jgi:rfaE bifunctional protein kinase chain/domain
MNRARFEQITSRYPHLRIAVLGDFCLDRYLEIDPTRQEASLETGLPVHNVTRVRAQPGAAGTILNNLVALGIGSLHPIGFAGHDAEGHELRQALAQLPGVHTDSFLATPHRRTFCYTKPVVVRPNSPPEELSRLDFKNWSPTPLQVEDPIIQSLHQLLPSLHALVVLDQVDLPDTGVITTNVRNALGQLAAQHPNVFVIADSRRGLRDFPPLSFKMNTRELASLTRTSPDASLDTIKAATLQLARANRRPVFITLAERGILAAAPDQPVIHLPALPVHGEIDIVGAGDAVTANLAAAIAADAQLDDALALANTAASIVIHQLGTTGTASPAQLAQYCSP